MSDPISHRRRTNMANWLSRATEAFRKPPPPAPEPFNVRCDCGGSVTGDRASAAQRPACPNCGRPVFVLPVNVYPNAVKPKKADPAEPAGKKVAERDAPAVATSPPGTQRRQATPSTPATTPKPAEPKPDGILVEGRSRLLTPLRLIVAVIVLVGIATGYGLWHRQKVANARLRVVAASEAGMKALKEKDFVVAARELTVARDAVNLLGRTDPDAALIRRHCREAIAANELVGAGLFEILSDYAADLKAGKPRLNSRYRDAWIVLDSVVANPESADRPCILDMPVVLDGVRFRIEVDSAAIRTSAQREQTTGWARVIVAAQLSEIRPPSADSAEAVLVLESKTAFLWTTWDTFAAIGYAEDRPEEIQLTKEILNRQLEQSEGSK